MHGAAHEEFVCEVVDELADWDYLKVSVRVWYRSASGKVPYNAEAFWLIYLQVTIIRDVDLHTGAAYVITERKSSLYGRILLGMVSGESRARRGNILRKVPVALWRMVCKCFVKSSLESNRRPRYFTLLDQGMVTVWDWRGCGSGNSRFVNNMSSV